jgi:hypothetical protein
MNLELPGPATRSGWLLRRGAWASASAYNYRQNRGAMTVLSKEGGVHSHSPLTGRRVLLHECRSSHRKEGSRFSHRKESTLRTYKRVFMGGGLKSSSLYGSTSSGLCVWCQFRPTSWVMTRSAEGGCETSGGICPLTDPLELTLFPVSDLCR